VKALFVVLFAGALCATLSSCSGPARAVAEASPGAPSVAVAAVTVQTLERQLALSAEFRPYQEVDLHAKVAGYLKQINVDVGDRVRAGDLIATLEVPEMADDAAQAEALRLHSESEWVRAKGELSRMESTHEAGHLAYQRLSEVAKSRPNLIARQELDEALSKDKSAEAAIDSAKAAISSAEQQIRGSEASQKRLQTLETYTKIIAPFAGVISKRYADTGALIQAGTASSSQAMPLVRLSQVDRLRLVLDVPESAVPQIHVGVPIHVRVGAIGRDFTGRVSRFSDRLQSSTRTMETEVDVLNPGGELAPGMYAEVRLTVERRDRALSVPVEAVTGADDKASLLVVNPQNRLERRDVVLGMETPERREVVKGLAAGDRVVIGKIAALHAGDAVEPQKAQ
jgi:RND family efflux transporter MFP subunit